MNVSKIAAALAGALALAVAGVASATTITQDFESSGYQTYADSGNQATLSTDQANSSTHSIALGIPDNSGEAGVYFDVNPGQVRLGGAVGTYQAYVPDTSGNTQWVPYVYYWVDTNQNGVADALDSSGDSLVIAFYGVTYKASHVVSGTWQQWGIFDNTNVHVYGNQTGLGGNFTTSGSPGVGGPGNTFSDLGNTTLSGSMTWGDLDILRMYVEASAGSTSLNDYLVYVDDMQLNGTGAAVSVPEPGELGLMGLGLLLIGGLAFRLQKKDRRANSRDVDLLSA